ncbi:MAG: WD40 repeat domain-containing protein [Planctomycetaceae bacterium]
MRSLIGVCLVVVGILSAAQGLWGEESAAATDGERGLKGQIALLQFELGLHERDVSRDDVRAAHLLLHAGLNAYAAGDEQLAIDAGHAAQEALGAIDFTLQHSGEVTGVSLSPNEELLCSWSRKEKTIHIWSLVTTELVASLKVDRPIGSVEFHPTERLVLIKAFDKAMFWWIDKPEAYDEFSVKRDPKMSSVAGGFFTGKGTEAIISGARSGPWTWKPGSQPILVAEDDLEAMYFPYRIEHQRVVRPTAPFVRVTKESATIWDTEKRQLIQEFLFTEPLLQAIYSHDRQELITWSRKGEHFALMQSWTVGRREPQHDFQVSSEPRGVESDNQGRYFVTWHQNGRPSEALERQLDIWSWSERKVVATLEHENAVVGAMFDPSGQYLASWGDSGEFKVWSIGNPQEIARDGQGRIAELRVRATVRGNVERAFFHPNNDIVSADCGSKGIETFQIGTRRIYGPPYSKELSDSSRPVRTLHGPMLAALFTADGKRIVTYGDGRLIRVWNASLRAPNVVMPLKNSQQTPARFHSFLAGNRLLTAGDSNFTSLALWSMDEKKKLWEITGSDRLSVVAHSPRGSQLIIRRSKVNRINEPAANPKDSQVRIELHSTDRADSLVKQDHWEDVSGHWLFIDEQRFLSWHGTEVGLFQVGTEEPIRIWKTTEKFGQVAVSGDLQSIVVTTRGKFDYEGSVLIYRLDAPDPIFELKSEGRFQGVTLLPSKDGFLITYGADKDTPVPAHLIHFDRSRPQVTFHDMTKIGHNGLHFDDQLNLMLTAHSDSRRAWLWSAKTGKQLYQFHRRDPKTSGFEENDIMHFIVDPQGRFLISSGGAPISGSGDLEKIWILSDLPSEGEWFPRFQKHGQTSEIGTPSLFRFEMRKDGTFFGLVNDSYVLRSYLRPDRILRRVESIYDFASNTHKAHIHPETGYIYGITSTSDLVEWPVQTWMTADFQRELADLERRSQQRLDPGTMELKVIPISPLAQ